MMLPKTIAVDGPAGSGKSTVGRLLAERLGYAFIDSGILYRAIARAVLVHGISPTDQEGVLRHAESYHNEIIRARSSTASLPGSILAQVADTGSLHTPEIDNLVPIVARHEGVRDRIRKIQRALAANGRVVMAGRDIGTVVLPDAELKVYLTASLEERARRRYSDMAKLGLSITMAEILRDLRRRDALDESREVSPMKPANDALIIEADCLTPPELVDRIVRSRQLHRDEKQCICER